MDDDDIGEIGLLDEVNTDQGIKPVQIGDHEVPLFLYEWLKNGCNATKAYKSLHPDITDGSARVLASRKLAKVNTSALLASFGIEYTDLFKGLKEGLQAKKIVSDGIEVPDYKTRLDYLKTIAKLLNLQI